MSARPAEEPDTPDAVFDALGDPTRRRIIGLLVELGPSTASTLATRLPISRQAVAKHLDHLRAAGVTGVQRVGREARHDIVPHRLDDASAWLETTARAWQGRLSRIQRELDRRRTT